MSDTEIRGELIHFIFEITHAKHLAMNGTHWYAVTIDNGLSLLRGTEGDYKITAYRSKLPVESKKHITCVIHNLNEFNLLAGTLARNILTTNERIKILWKIW